VHEAVERLVGYDEWFCAMVELAPRQSIAVNCWKTMKSQLEWKSDLAKTAPD